MEVKWKNEKLITFNSFFHFRQLKVVRKVDDFYALFFEVTNCYTFSDLKKN